MAGRFGGRVDPPKRGQGCNTEAVLGVDEKKVRSKLSGGTPLAASTGTACSPTMTVTTQARLGLSSFTVVLCDRVPKIPPHSYRR